MNKGLKVKTFEFKDNNRDCYRIEVIRLGQTPQNQKQEFYTRWDVKIINEQNESIIYMDELETLYDQPLLVDQIMRSYMAYACNLSMTAVQRAIPHSQCQPFV